MKLKAVIFDMDGTIMDSMPFWGEIGAWYLRSLGIEPTEDLGKKFFSMTLEDAEAYLKTEYDLPQSLEEIGQGVLAQTDIFYSNHVEMKPGMKEFLLGLKARGVKTAIATVTDRPLVKKALKRTGAEELIDGIITTQEVGVGKRSPDVFFEALKITGTEKEETLVVEDALHALETAKKAGFVTAAVYDEQSEDVQNEMEKTADYYLDKNLDYDLLLKLF